MSTYASAKETFSAADARRELAQALQGRFQPLEGSPAELYAVRTRRLPADTVRACADLWHLPPPIDGRPPQDHALVSLLRDPATGDITGFQLEFCDILGATTDTEPRKITYALREHGARDGLFFAGGNGDVAYLTEGYSCKALAVASLGIGKAYGQGGRTVLGFAVPPEQTVAVVPDRRPDDKVVDLRTGKSAADQHDADLKHGIDRLLLAGKTVLVAKAPECQHPGGGACKDSDDYLRRHGPIRLKDLVEATEISALSLDGEARKLAQIEDPLERDAQTKVRAAELKVRVALLRDRVTHYREARRTGAAHETDATGSELVFEELQPAAEKQDGDALLGDIAAAIRRHVFLDDSDLTKAVLWTVHGHRRFHDNVAVLPRIVVTAGRWDSGKSSLARVLKHLSDVAHYTTSPTPPNIFRPIEEHKCAFFLDEADNWFPRSEGMRDILNSGFTEEEANVLRTEDLGTGGRRVLKSRRYSTFAPIGIVGLHLERILPQPVISRAIVIHMRPARVGEVAEEVTGNRRAVAHLRTLAARVKRWIADNERALSAAGPELPTGVINRLKLIWSPLLAIADRAGGDWPRKAREALEIDRGRERDPNLGEQLLLDVRDIMAAHGHAIGDDTAMHTGQIIEQLLQIELRTWSAFGKARAAIRDTDIARLLIPYEVRPSQIKISALNRNGYRLTSIQEAVDRYVCAPDTPESVYPSTSPEKSQSSAGFEVGAAVDGSGAGSTFGPEVDPTSNAASTAFTEENQSGRGVEAAETPGERIYTNGDDRRGLGGDAGGRGGADRGNEHACGRPYHDDDACVGAIRRRLAAPDPL
jgi:hypothetical protein